MNEYIESVSVRYNLYDDIENFDAYEEFIGNMMHYSSQDQVSIHINSGGGRVDIGGTIVNAIKTCKAYVTCIVEEPSYSMAAIIALSGDSLVMMPRSLLMFHNYSTYASGKGKELVMHVNNTDRHYNRMIQDLCSPFLTCSELKAIEHDQDVYIYPDDSNLKRRIMRHYK